MTDGDPRVGAYADVLVGTCIDVQPGWQVVVRGMRQARPLLEALYAAIARRDAFAIERVALAG